MRKGCDDAEVVVGAEWFFTWMRPRIEMGEIDPEMVVTLPPPEMVTLPLSRPGQMPFEPLVKVGDRVVCGQYIAATPSRTGVHATITGEVTRIGPIFTPEGREVLGIRIAATGNEEWVEPRSIEDLRNASGDQLMAAFTELGFDSPWKPASLQERLGADEAFPIHTVVIVAVDRDPGVCVQRRFLTEFKDDLADSIEAIRRMAGDARIVVAVPRRMKAQAASILGDVEILPVGDAYLENDWRLILARVAGRRNVSIRRARREGYVLLTAENIAFAGRCLKKGLPRTNKLVTLLGEDFGRPMTVRVRLGTPIRHVLDHFGISVTDGDRVLLGGRMRGEAQYDLEAPITLQTDALTVIRAKEIPHRAENPCVNCGRCYRVCPVDLPVHLIGRHVEFGLMEEAAQMGIEACLDCGLCSYVCPASRPLLQYVRFARALAEQAREEERAVSVEDEA